MAKKNFDDFYNTHNGKAYDLDGNGHAYCTDGFWEYLRWGNGHGIIHGNAWDEGAAWQSNGLSDFCKNVTGQQYKNGDIMFYTGAQAGNGAGHVGMYYNGRCFGQNQNTDGNGGPFNTGVPYNIGGGPGLVLRPDFVGKPDIWITCVNGLITSLRIE